MSDRTYAWAVVYECPEQSTAAVLTAIVHDTGLSETLDRYDGEPAETSLLLGERYSDPECRCGETDSLAATLLDLGCTFECGEDARYEYPGLLTRGAPSLGLHVVLQFEGELHLGETELLTAIAGTSGRDDLVSMLNESLGTAWRDAIDRCRRAIPS